MAKPKRENKNKDQIAWEMKQKAEAQRKRKFIAEYFFPMLLRRTKSITQAKNFCKVFQNDVLATFNQGMIKPMGELNMKDRFEGVENEAAEAYRDAIETFKDLPIGEVLELFDGMPGAIDAALTANDRERPLTDLEWNDGNLTVKKHG